MLWCGCCRSFVLRHLAITSSVPFSLYFKSDQHQSSPNNVNTYLREKVIRINQLITKGKVLWSFNKISELISWEMFGGEFGELACGYWDFLRVIWNLWKFFNFLTKLFPVLKRGFVCQYTVLFNSSTKPLLNRQPNRARVYSCNHFLSSLVLLEETFVWKMFSNYIFAFCWAFGDCFDDNN